MNAQSTATSFDFANALGDGTLAVKTFAGTLKAEARLARDFTETPSPEVYNAADIAAWESREWTFWYMTISIWIGNVCIESHAGFLGGIDCVDDEYRNNDHLNEVAADLLRQACVPGIVKKFAREVSAAVEADAS
jgi:hypothetical protein